MSGKIVCAGHLLRYPLGGHTWHHLQYLVGFSRLGYDVTYFEHFGWPSSCYDPAFDADTGDPRYGLHYLDSLLERYGLGGSWCFLAEDGTTHGLSRERLADDCRDCDLFVNLSNVNWIPELEACRRRVLIDTDPVFTQIGGHGVSDLNGYDVLFTFGENVNRADCSMPTGGFKWFPTRQPVVLDEWAVRNADPFAGATTVMNWSAYGDRLHEGRLYGQKDREFEPFFTLPRETGQRMEIALSGAPPDVVERLRDGGWRVADPRPLSADPWAYQRYVQSSRFEFCVAKHAYVTTGSGWFSERSAGYLSSGRPVVVQDTGFSANLPCGAGLHAFRTKEQAIRGVTGLRDDYESECRAARALAEEHFDADRVLTQLLEQSL